MTANEETKVAQMVDRYETKIRGLDCLVKQLWESLQRECNLGHEHIVCYCNHPKKTDINCIQATCPLMPKGE
jgi:hypothetical protein